MFITAMPVHSMIYQKCMVASKCSQHHFISEKYKTVQSLHFLQNCPLVQPHTSAVTVKVFETFLEAIL